MEWRKASAELHWLIRHSRLAIPANHLERAVAAAITEWFEPTPDLDARFRDVVTRAEDLASVAQFLADQGDRYFARELEARLLPNPLPASLLGTDDPPALLTLTFRRRRDQWKVNRIRARAKRERDTLER